MAEIINLRLARKTKARAASATAAETNRARHGRTKLEKQSVEAERERLARVVDGAKRETD